VRGDDPHCGRGRYALFPAMVTLFTLCGCQNNPKEIKQRQMIKHVLNLEQENGWQILVHGMDEISYFSPSRGKLQIIYSRFHAPNQTWMGFGSIRSDGRKLIFVTKLSGSASASLVMFDTQTHKQETLLNIPYLFGPRWSPNGERIAFSCRSEVSGSFDLKVYEPGSSRTSLIVSGELPSGEGYIDWSPDGQSIVYESISGEVQIVDIRTRERRTLARGGVPRWSPDGNRIVYHKEAEDSVTVRNLQSGESRDVLVGKKVRNIVWSPDGRFIAYSRPYSGLSKQIQDASMLADTYGDLWALDTQSGAELKLFSGIESIYPTYWGIIAR
jgi:Tol biopolymer transport system component